MKYLLIAQRRLLLLIAGLVVLALMPHAWAQLDDSAPTATAVTADAVTTVITQAGPGTLPPACKPWGSVDGVKWIADDISSIEVPVGTKLSFKVTTLTGTTLANNDWDVVESAASNINTDQGAATLVCQWDFNNNGTTFNPETTVAVDAVVSKTFDKVGTYIVICRTDDCGQTAFDDPPTVANTGVYIFVLGDIDQQAFKQIEQIQEVLLPQNKLTEAVASGKDLELLLKAELSPKIRSQIYVTLAAISEANGDLATARAYFLQAMQVAGAPELQITRAQFSAAWCLGHMEKYDAAIAELEALIAQHPGCRAYCGESRALIGTFLAAQDKCQEALVQYRRVIAEYSDTGWQTSTQILIDGVESHLAERAAKSQRPPSNPTTPQGGATQ
jgi:hypothetical protein